MTTLGTTAFVLHRRASSIRRGKGSLRGQATHSGPDPTPAAKEKIHASPFAGLGSGHDSAAATATATATATAPTHVRSDPPRPSMAVLSRPTSTPSHPLLCAVLRVVFWSHIHTVHAAPPPWPRRDPTIAWDPCSSRQGRRKKKKIDSNPLLCLVLLIVLSIVF